MGRGMSRGLCGMLWQLAAALYLIANGVLGLQQRGLRSGGVFHEILRNFFRGDNLNLFLVVLSVIALVAGIAILLDLFSVELPFLNMLTLVVAIVWAVYVVVTIISWLSDGGDFFQMLSTLAINVMVLASLLSASKRFG